MNEAIFYAAIGLGLYFGTLALCWRQWTEEDRQMQEEKEKYRLLCEEADKITQNKGVFDDRG